MLLVLQQGTDFMLQLADWLKAWAASKVTGDTCFKHVAFVVSDASEPGEGEHKVRSACQLADSWHVTAGRQAGV